MTFQRASKSFFEFLWCLLCTKSDAWRADLLSYRPVGITADGQKCVGFVLRGNNLHSC